MSKENELVVKLPNEHLYELVKVRQAIFKTGLKASAKGQFDNPYVPLEDIIAVVEPILLQHNFLTTCTERFDIPSKNPLECFFEMTITYAPTMQQKKSVVSLVAEKDTPQKKRSAYTYALRSLYCTLLALPVDKDDDGHAAEVSVNDKYKQQTTVRAANPMYD